MDIWIRIYQFLNTQIETPTSYGWFHILSFVLSVGLGVLLCATHKKGDDRRVRRVVLIVAIVVAVLELYKQFNFSFSVEDNALVFDFQWYAFPWQFCSMPMYVGLLTAIFRRGRIHRALCSFLATYAIFAGICVMAYPGDVFVPILGICIQTMVCHGSMLSVGIYLLYTNYAERSHKTILRALPVFVCAVGGAVLLNEIMYHSGVIGDEIFNMFFVSPHFDPSLPVYSLVQGAVPYPVCLIIYILGFTLAAYLVLLLAMLIERIASKLKK